MDRASAREHSIRLGHRFYLATNSPSGFPNVTPIDIAWPDPTGPIYIATTNSSWKVKDIASSPKVTLHSNVGADYDQLRVRGTATVRDDAETRARLWKGVFGYDLAMFFGSADNPQLCYLAIEPSRIVLDKMMGQNGRETWPEA